MFSKAMPELFGDNTFLWLADGEKHLRATGD